MEQHRFTIGDRVRVFNKAPDSAARPGIYTIVKALPLAGRGLQYRARNDTDPYELILDDVSIRRADG